MTPVDQVKAIIAMLSPEDTITQTDAVFLVQKHINETNQKIKDLQKQMALADARIENEQKKRNDADAEKVKVQNDLSKVTADFEDSKKLAKPIPAGKADTDGSDGKIKEPKNG